MQLLSSIKVAIIAIIMTLSGLTASAGTHDTTVLIQALIKVESNGNDYAIGDRTRKEKAYGPLQIRKPCVDDVNRRCGTKIEAKSLLGDRVKSVWVCQKYLETYATQKRLGREPTHEDMARIWNGGPSGWKRNDTNAYWAKVRKQLRAATIEVANYKP
jgi:hypothetical protein